MASEVQLEHPGDTDQVRFAITGEAGLNDGMAFPFVMLGLGLMGLHSLGDWGEKWILVDVLWAVIAGLGIGWLCGKAVAYGLLKLREKNKSAEIYDDFLALGLIALSYGLAHVIAAYGFLAVFAAGMALRNVHVEHKDGESVPDAVLSFSEQMERIGEVLMVLILGSMFHYENLKNPDLLFIPIMLLLIRPISVYLGLIGHPMKKYQKPLISWFGIRGIGSLYYLTYAIGYGIPLEISDRLQSIVYFTVVISILIHGITVQPIMSLYQRLQLPKSRNS